MNPFARIPTSAAETICQNPATQVRITLADAAPHNRRRYNKPVNETIAAIIPEVDDGARHRDLTIRNRDGNIHRLYETSPYYLALRYVIIFPFGERS